MAHTNLTQEEYSTSAIGDWHVRHTLTSFLLLETFLSGILVKGFYLEKR